MAARSWVSGVGRSGAAPGALCPLIYTCLPPTPTGGGWLLKAVSLGSWVHLIEELQVFDQEPVESLVLSRSKVVISTPLCPSAFPCLLLGHCRGGEGHWNTPRLAWGGFQETRVLTESALRGRYI